MLGRTTLIAVLVFPWLSACGQSPGAAGRPAPPASDELWYVIYLDQLPVGYLQARRATVPHTSDQLWSQKLWMSTRRHGQTTRQEITWSCRQDAAGRPQQFSWSVHSSLGTTTAIGTPADDGFRVRVTDSDRADDFHIPAAATCRGFAAVEQSLRCDPLAPGQSRSLDALAPLQRSPSHIRLAAIAHETITIGEQPMRLMKVLQHSQFDDGPALQSVLWVAEDGVIQRADTADRRIERTTRCAALALHDATPTEIGRLSLRVAGTPDNPQACQRIVYLVTTELPHAFVATDSQEVTPVAKGYRIQVRSRRPGVVSAETTAAPPTTKATANQSPTMELAQAADVAHVSRQVLPHVTDPWQVAVALERFVYESLDQQNSATPWASAANVMKQRKGDCTEHALLLAKLCEARDIPARVILGLVHVQEDEFGLHAWNEVRVGQQWFGLDATRGQGGVGAEYVACQVLPAHQLEQRLATACLPDQHNSQWQVVAK